MSKKPLMLTGKQARLLRSLGHHLSPTAMIGREGITDNVVKSAEAVLTARELIKVKIQENCPLDKKEAATTLAKKTRSGIAQIIGKTFLLYRENKDLPEDKKIKLPVKEPTES